MRQHYPYIPLCLFCQVISITITARTPQYYPKNPDTIVCPNTSAYSKNVYSIFDSLLQLKKTMLSTGTETDFAVASIKSHVSTIYSEGIGRPGMSTKNHTPKTIITGIIVNGKNYNRQDLSTSFSSNQNDITIGYTAINLSSDTITNYAYQFVNIDIAGKDLGWILAGNQRQIYFSGLGPGVYIFRVCIVINNKIQFENQASISFSVSPHFTQTTGFFGLLMLGTGLAFYSMYRFHLRQQKRTEQIRSEISRNLHDEVGSTLTNISLGSLLAQKQLPADSPVNRILDRIYQDSQSVSQTMREIVWSINPRVDTLSEALPRMLHYASELLEAKNIELGAEIAPGIEHVKFSMYKRRDLYFIFKEAVNNLAKHSGADHVNVNVQLIRHTLTMAISDDGTGFDPAVSPGGNGLKNMRERAQNHHWQLTIQSVPNIGTTILLKAQIA